VKKYTQVYVNHFNYTTSCFIPCEVCGRKAVDIHHIEARSKRKDLENDISNLQALCRECHIKFGDKKEFKDYLKEVHNNRMNGQA
jgi:5-methylcytosine-specific restriction endonuclease McrA